MVEEEGEGGASVKIEHSEMSNLRWCIQPVVYKTGGVYNRCGQNVGDKHWGHHTGTGALGRCYLNVTNSLDTFATSLLRQSVLRLQFLPATTFSGTRFDATRSSCSSVLFCTAKRQDRMSAEKEGKVGSAGMWQKGGVGIQF